MTKSKLFLTACAVIFIMAAMAIVAQASEPKALTGDETAPPNIIYAPSGPGLITDSPGIIVGTTQYDYQENGSTGNRIVSDVAGGKHFSWMNASPFPSPRNIYYNYVDPVGVWLSPGVGVQVNDGAAAGYTTISALSDNRGVVAYHQASLRYITEATESTPGGGVFSINDPPDQLTNRTYWPYVTVDRQDRIHITSSEQVAPQAFGYSRSSDGGVTWTDIQPVDSVYNLATIIVSSLVSDKVAIVYTHQITSGYDCDVYYVMSQDGETWDFANGKVNVTDYQNTGGTQRAYDDLDAIFDYNDNFHIIWNTGLSGSMTPPINLMHYNLAAGQINTITTQNYTVGCLTGAWNIPIAKMSLGVGPNDALFAIWTQFDTADASDGNYCNGELYMSYTTDGSVWSTPVDMTNTHTPGCAAGNCDSDHWSSLAEQVDTALHIVYIDDKDAGGIPQTEGAATTNPVMYLAYPNPIFAGGAPEFVIGPNPAELTLGPNETGTLDLTIGNQGVAPLQYAVSETISWLTIPYVRGALDEGETAGFVLGFDATGLTEGTYTGEIYFRSNDQINPTFTINAILHVGVSGCDYMAGDINNNGAANGIDVVYGVNYLKGMSPPPVDCFPVCQSLPSPFYAAMDVNGNCAVNGIDVTFFVRFLKGQVPALLYCPDCPPAP